MVGTFVDKHTPRWGKYRSYLVLGGIPLTGFAILCFWDGFSGSLLYAYITYVGMSMCYTLINVPYGAPQLVADPRHQRNNHPHVGAYVHGQCRWLGCGVGHPLVVAFFAPKDSKGEAIINAQQSSQAWFITMALYAVVGLVLLFFCFSQCHERVVMDAKETSNVRVSDLWKEFVRNRPLRVLAFFFITAFAMMSVGNAAGSYYMTYNMQATSSQLSVFMGLGSVPAFIFMPMVPAIKRRVGKRGMFNIFLSIAIVGMVILYIVSMVPSLKHQLWLVYVAQFIKSTGVIVATGYMWALVPEVISYGEYTTGRRISGIVNALTGIFFKAGMALGGVVPGLVLAYVHFDAQVKVQTPMAEQGILWLVCVIPALLLILAMWIISKYELTDELVDCINRDIEQKQK